MRVRQNGRVWAWVLVVVAVAGPATAQNLEQLSRAYQKKPTPANHNALIRLARAHPRDSTGALALLAAGAIEAAGKQYDQAARHLAEAGRRLPALADYAAYWQATAQFAAEEYGAVQGTLAAVWGHTPASPLSSRAVMLAARADVKAGRSKDALALLKQHYDGLPQPQGDMALAEAYEAAGDLVNAAIYDQRVYYGYPLSSQASAAASDSTRMREELGDNYPPAMPQTMLARAMKLLGAGQEKKARQELEELIPMLGGAERDLARVRVGVADYQAEDNGGAFRYLRSLEVSSAEADAERLYYLMAAARRLNNLDEVTRVLEQMARLYPRSPWRLKALVWAGNYYLLANQADAYEPLYRTCYEGFPKEPQAGYCHWKVAWAFYIRRKPEAAAMLRDQLRDYPDSDKSPAALYFLGRLAENDRDYAAARAYYDELNTYYPNYYYASLARERLREAAVRGAKPAAQTVEYLRGIPFPQRVRTKEFEPDAASRLRIERARLLASAGLDDWADGELKFGAQTGDQPQVLAMELARLAEKRSAPDLAIRWVKHYAAGYLNLPLDSAPQTFWRLAFPMPYRQELERYSRQVSLDPFLVAALVRQESEFNPKAVSRAKAYGLTQILPQTGRELARRLKLGRYRTSMLFQPSVNLRLGTNYLKSLIDQLGGKWEVALASYNAGKSRAVAWLNWADFREAPEYIETIPITETRNYIETVFRNAEIYRRLYGTAETRGQQAQSERERRGAPAPSPRHTVQ